MLNFIARRTLQMIPVLIGVTLAIFLLSRVVPGDPVAAILGPGATEEASARLRDELGLNRPYVVQYIEYLLGLLKGDLGRSYTFSRPISEILFARLANTALIAVSATMLASILGIALGTWAALKAGSVIDRALTVIVLLLTSMPAFWLGLILIIVFGLKLGIFPISGMTSIVNGGGVLDVAFHMVLPTLTLAAWSLATIARMTRSALLEVIDNDYIRTARSRGIGEMRVVLGHALPNAMPTIITVIGLQLGFSLGGAVMTETVFAWPGIGLAMYEGILQRDIPLIQSGILVLAIIFVLINFLVDVLYAYFNPKITLE